MLVKKHIILGFIFSAILFFVFGNVGFIGAGIIFLSSFLIDVDHYIYYLFTKKDFNFFNGIKYFKTCRKKASRMSSEKKRKYYSGWCFLHGVEILIILVILGFFVSRYFFFVFIGFVFHLFLDLIEEISNEGRIDKISCIYDWFKFKRLKRF